MKNSAQKFWECANKILPLHIILKIVQTDPTRTHIKRSIKEYGTNTKFQCVD